MPHFDVYNIQGFACGSTRHRVFQKPQGNRGFLESLQQYNTTMDNSSLISIENGQYAVTTETRRVIYV